MLIECGNCHSRGDVSLPDDGGHGLLACPNCCEPAIAMIDVTDWREFIFWAADEKQKMQRQGVIRSRKQDAHHGDRQINVDGLAAELAACILIAPRSIEHYKRIALSGSNRGRDLGPALTGLRRPVEIKQTRYRDDARGFLLVRPPVRAGKRMFPHLLDDSYYVLLCGHEFRFRVGGWIDAPGLRQAGALNPVPVTEGRCECWGIHWSKLWPLAELATRFRN